MHTEGKAAIVAGASSGIGCAMLKKILSLLEIWFFERLTSLSGLMCITAWKCLGKSG
jgi:hypothetical protein